MGGVPEEGSSSSKNKKDIEPLYTGGIADSSERIEPKNPGEKVSSRGLKN